ncbi:DUF3847 domain-containing protein [Bifidobacterium merycicum]|uniref:DUF3847 domain-containing protein n=1 Tax=Bifidobacterium merycicum TaxID=78345 RepID=A0A087BK60_9BIFI|nr:DUF3847 domain-containing protein [Bifidobacterium merycicum]KFI71410.1 hypothetical protein BMERY_3005 [Bifidobacterium merycicum]SHE27443.1 Protein of unknown function [Bifidobacterium merycicum DSM 6492]
MAKTKAEKIAAIELQMTQLENQRKKLIQEQKQQERKDRTKRLCKRMGLFESMLPESISLTDEQFQIFLENHSRRSQPPHTGRIDSAAERTDVRKGHRLYGSAGRGRRGRIGRY